VERVINGVPVTHKSIYEIVRSRDPKILSLIMGRSWEVSVIRTRFLGHRKKDRKKYVANRVLATHFMALSPVIRLGLRNPRKETKKERPLPEAFFRNEFSRTRF